MKPRKTKSTKPSLALTVQEYNWGSLFVGTKAAILKAGLAAPEHFPARRADEKEYQLPLDHAERYRECVYGPQQAFGPMPRSWGASIVKNAADEYSVFVRFDPTRDLDTSTRVYAALSVLRKLWTALENIPPIPVSKQLGIKAR